MAIIVTPLRGMCASALNVIAPVMPGKLLVDSSAFLTAWASVEPARFMASASRYTAS